MRIRTFAAALVLAAAAAVPLAGVASAQDRDCTDFDTQQEAQNALRGGDPERLDDDGDGIACELLPGAASGSSSSNDNSNSKSDDNGDDKSDDNDEDGQVRTKPKGSVDTGDGSSAPDPTPVLAIAAGGVIAAGAAAAVRRRPGSSR